MTLLDDSAVHTTSNKRPHVLLDTCCIEADWSDTFGQTYVLSSSAVSSSAWSASFCERSVSFSVVPYLSLFDARYLSASHSTSTSAKAVGTQEPEKSGVKAVLSTSPKTILAAGLVPIGLF